MRSDSRGHEAFQSHDKNSDGTGKPVLSLLITNDCVQRQFDSNHLIAWNII